MAATFAGVFLLHFVITTFLPSVFGVSPLTALSWIKCVATALSIVAASEAYKFAYRLIKKEKTEPSRTFGSAIKNEAA